MKKGWHGITVLPNVKKLAIQTIAILYNSDDTPVTAEGVLVLQGKQGIGKTQFFRHFKNFWKWQSASEIANLLNEKFKNLRISSVKIGKLLVRIEGRVDVVFEQKL